MSGGPLWRPTRRLTHEAEAAELREPEPWSVELAALDEDLRATAVAIEPVRDGVLLDALPSPSYAPERWRPSRAAATAVVHGGESIELGDRRLAVLHLPGHSPGSIGLLDEHSFGRAGLRSLCDDYLARRA